MTTALRLCSRVTDTGVFETHIYVDISTHKHWGCAYVYFQNRSIILVKMFFNTFSQQYKQGHSVFIDQENAAIRQVVLFWKPKGQYRSCSNKGNNGYLWMICKKMELFTGNAFI